MLCSYCGAEVHAGEIFCRNCGTRQEPVPVKEPEFFRETPSMVTEDELFFEFPEIHIPEELKAPPAEEAFEMPVPRPAPQPVAQPAAQPVVQAAPRTVYVPYGAPEQGYARKAPMLQLPTSRGLAKMIFLGLLTLGIYPIVIWSRIVTELNIAASRYDGERTMPYFAMVWLAPFTLMIYPLVWIHGFCRRIGTELKRRGIGYPFGASTFWLWNVLGSLIIVGPFVFVHKMMKAMNLINQNFNING